VALLAVLGFASVVLSGFAVADLYHRQQVTDMRLCAALQVTRMQVVRLSLYLGKPVAVPAAWPPPCAAQR
jgi:hypothetical protein